MLFLLKCRVLPQISRDIKDANGHHLGGLQNKLFTPSDT